MDESSKKTIKVRCPCCEGETCGTCNGKGFIEISWIEPMFGVKCPRCKGSKIRWKPFLNDHLVFMPCEVCNGNGELKYYKDKNILIPYT